MTIPSGGLSAVTGLNQQKAFNPNGLYEALESSKDAYEPEAVQQAQQQAQQSQQKKLMDILLSNLNTTFTLQENLWGETQRVERRSAPKGQKIRITRVFTGEDEDTGEDKLLATIDVGRLFQGFEVDAQELHDAIADQL